MAQKRAMVAAVLVGTGASQFFTPDVEDLAEHAIDAEFVELKHEPAPATQQATHKAASTPSTTTPEAQHWTADGKALGRFWAWTKTLGLLSDQVHDALECESVNDFAGNKAEAAAKVKAYAEGLRAAAAMQADASPEAPQEDDGTNDW